MSTRPVPIPEHPRVAGEDCEYLKRHGICYHCCEACNYDNHDCHFCGDSLNHYDMNWDHSPHPCYEVEVK